MNIKRFFCYALFLLLLLINDFASNNVYASETDKNETTIHDNDLYARSAVLLDAESGRILYGKNCDESMAMASTTKIMTLIVTLENANMNDTVTVSKYAASMPDVQLNIKTGEQYLLKDLLYSLMLESHNDSAAAIAEHIGGSIEGFSKLMNQKAKEIGCKNSYFITPNGLDATAKVKGKDGEEKEVFHSTTSADLAKIMAYCIMKSPKKEEFLEITRTTSYSFSDIDKKRNFSCNNHNAFLNMMDGALSGKTGFTTKAGYCYVGALKKDNRTFVVALLACGWPNNKTYKWSDTKKLMNYGLNTFTYHSFDEVKLDKNELSEIPVKDAKTNRIGRTAYASIYAIEKETKSQGILMKDEEKIEIEYQIKSSLTAPIMAKEKVGVIMYKVGDEVWKEYDVIVKNSIEKIDFNWCLQKILEKWSA